VRDPVAVPDADSVFADAREFGGDLDADRLFLAETIPGGTTTAMAVLAALGEQTGVSSSLPENPVDLKRDVVREGLAASGLERGDLAGEPTEAVHRMGDPVLAAVAGLAVGALEGDTDVVLAGGTQLATAGALVRHADIEDPLTLATTSFVAGDGSANVRELAASQDLDLRVTDPGFDERSDHPAMAAYLRRRGEGRRRHGRGARARRRRRPGDGCRARLAGHRLRARHRTSGSHTLRSGVPVGVSDLSRAARLSFEQGPQSFCSTGPWYALSWAGPTGSNSRRRPGEGRNTPMPDITLTVNDQRHELTVEPRTLLVTALREKLDYTGANVGCETGRCGACTVRQDGDAIKSCTRLAVQADGATIDTVEGLAGTTNSRPSRRSSRRTTASSVATARRGC